MSTTEQISTTELRELRRIIKDRFELLGAQLFQREREISRRVSAEIEKQHLADIRSAEKQAAQFQSRLDKLEQEYIKFLSEYEDKGVEAINPSRYYKHDHIFEDSVLTQRFRPLNLAARTQERVDEIKIAAGAERLNLRGIELELSEELAVGQIKSDSAKSFLSRIPTVDQLLPLPKSDTLAISE